MLSIGTGLWRHGSEMGRIPEGAVMRRFLRPALISLLAAVVILATGCGEKKSSEPGDGSGNGPDDGIVTLTVEICSGVGGGPGPGVYPYVKGDTVDYFYVLDHGYSDLLVLLDSVAVADSGSIVLDRDRSLVVLCERRVIWEVELEKQVYYCAPAVGDDGTIYVSTGLWYWTEWGRLHAVSPEGDVLWSYDLDHNGYSPTVGLDGTIYIQDAQNFVYALNPDGTLRWKFTDFDLPDHPRYDVGQRVPAIGADGTVYAPADGLYALDPETGVRLWRFNPRLWKSCRQSPVIGADGTIYIFIHQHDLYAVNPDGTEKWHAQLDDEREMSFACPAIDTDGTLYIPAEMYHDSFLYAFTSGGTFKWKYTVEGEGRLVRASPTIAADGTIYIATKAYGPEVPSKIIALDPSGAEVWEYVVAHTHATAAGDDIYSTPSVGADGTIYFGSENEYFYALNPDGTLKWKCPLGYGINWTSAAILDDGTLYIGSMHSSPGFNGRLWALETESMGYAASPWPRFRHDNKNTGRFGPQ
jgi:outer membrane protein assembly factor BamB